MLHGDSMQHAIMGSTLPWLSFSLSCGYAIMVRRRGFVRKGGDVVGGPHRAQIQIYLYLYLYLNLSLSLYIYIYICIHIYIHIYIYIYIYSIIFQITMPCNHPMVIQSNRGLEDNSRPESSEAGRTYIYMYMYVCIYIYTYIHIHIHICISTHINRGRTQSPDCVRMYALFMPYASGKAAYVILVHVTLYHYPKYNDNVSFQGLPKFAPT